MKKKFVNWSYAHNFGHHATGRIVILWRHDRVSVSFNIHLSSFIMVSFVRSIHLNLLPLFSMACILLFNARTLGLDWVLSFLNYCVFGLSWEILSAFVARMTSLMRLTSLIMRLSTSTIFVIFASLH